MAHPKLASVRLCYNNRCGYCGISEVDVGGNLTVDHFFPVSAGGGNEDDNLVYACIHCNQYKSAYFSDPVAQAQGLYLLHPLLDDLTLHFQENELSGELEALTVTGTFHIGLLQLNRDALAAHRRRNNYYALAENVRGTLSRENQELKDYVASLEKQLALLRGDG